MNRSKLPDFGDRLSTANEAKKAQLERAKALAERPERAERRKEREAIVAARNTRIDERKAAEAARKEREREPWGNLLLRRCNEPSNERLDLYCRVSIC
jgi:hypothetical protein